MPVLAERTKVCSACGEVKPWGDYYAKAKGPGGVMRQPHSRCKRCHVAAMRVVNRRARAKRRQDPERHAIFIVRTREWKRRRNGVTPDRYRQSRYMREAGLRRDDPPRLDPAPFLAWVDRARPTLSPSDSRTLLRLRSGEQEKVSIDVVDRITLAHGASIDDLYP